MQTITTTRWIDEKNSDLTFVETQLLASHPDETVGILKLLLATEILLPLQKNAI